MFRSAVRVVSTVILSFVLCIMMSCRLKQLQQEGGRLRQQCSELDQLLARASATIDQLASSCDL
jgi:cell division protein ZapA (FtsZ GTPase activity inhibitor)